MPSLSLLHPESWGARCRATLDCVADGSHAQVGHHEHHERHQCAVQQAASQQEDAEDDHRECDFVVHAVDHGGFEYCAAPEVGALELALVDVAEDGATNREWQDRGKWVEEVRLMNGTEDEVGPDSLPARPVLVPLAEGLLLVDGGFIEESKLPAMAGTYGAGQAIFGCHGSCPPPSATSQEAKYHEENDQGDP